MEAIKESLSQMNQMFHAKLAEFEEKQLKLSSPSSSDATSLAAEFSLFKVFVLSALRALQSQVEMNAQNIDNLEMQTRKNVLLLHGIPEDKKADISAVIAETIMQKVKVTDFRLEDITRCHRMGRSSDAGKPRPILFQLRDHHMRSKIWAAKKHLKGSGVTLSEFLTKPRHETFMLARQQFGISNCWSHEGFIFVLGDDGVKHRVSCVTDLDKIKVQSVAVAASKEPTTITIKEPSASKPRRTARK